MTIRDDLVDDLHRELTARWRARKIPASLREDWKQQIYVELLDLWAMFMQNNGSPADFNEYARRRIPSRMKAWWNGVKSWSDVRLSPEFDPDKFEAETTAPILLADITPIEETVWNLLLQGHTTAEIAAKIGKTADSVRHILSDIYDKEREAHRKEAEDESSD